MPLWNIYHTPNAFSTEDKQVLAVRISDLYKNIPRFYVGIVFQEVAADSFYIGGKPAAKFVRISIDHIARSLPTPQAKAWWIGQCDAALAPFVRDRGYDWEFHIDETPFDIWSIQGLKPPLPDSEAEKRWKSENKPTPYALGADS